MFWRVTKHLSYFWKKYCHQELSKIAQSNHTDLGQRFRLLPESMNVDENMDEYFSLGFCGTHQHRLWNLLENPNSSFAAKVREDNHMKFSWVAWSGLFLSVVTQIGTGRSTPWNMLLHNWQPDGRKLWKFLNVDIHGQNLGCIFKFVI